jgi:hypothetical protein
MRQPLRELELGSVRRAEALEGQLSKTIGYILQLSEVPEIVMELVESKASTIRLLRESESWEEDEDDS